MGGRCSLQLRWVGAAGGEAGAGLLLGGMVVQEDGVWRRLRGGFVQAVGAAAGQAQVSVVCGGLGDRFVFMDDVVVLRAE